jgi:alpha-beta hydrolase superfamily lysophospholipase
MSTPVPGAGTPVLFVHGLWLHATSWEPWVELFRAEGYAPANPGWPGFPETVEDARAHPEKLAGVGVQEVTDHYAGMARGLATPPIVIGHSFGGLVVQKLLGQGDAAAAVAIDAAAIKGVLALPLSTVHSAFPALRNPFSVRGTVPLDQGQFRYRFGNAVSEEESRDLHERWHIPAPGRPLWQGAFANLNPRSPLKVDTGNAERGPLLLTAGGRDHIIPPVITRSTHKKYRDSAAVTDIHEFPDRGHSLAADSGWRDVADHVLGWLRSHGL